MTQTVKGKQNLKQMLHKVEQTVMSSSDIELFSLERKQKHSVSQKAHCSTSFQSSLENLKKQQSQLRSKLRNILQNEKITKKSKYQKYEPHVQSNQKLRELTLQYRKFKMNLISKTKALEIKEQNDKRIEKQLQQKKKIQLCAEKRKMIQQKLEKMKLNREMMKRRFEEEKDSLKKLKKRKKLYERMTDKYLEDQSQLSLSKREDIKQKKNKSQIKISLLGKHEEEYNKLLKEKDEIRISRLKESTITLPPVSPAKSLFYNRILSYESSKKNEEKQSIEKKRELQFKLKQFNQKVDKQFKPSSKYIPFEKVERTQLTKQQVVEKGNEYMKQGNKKRKKKIENSPPQVKQKKEKYHNYLTDLPKPNLPTEKEHPHKKVLTEVEKVMKKENMSQVEKMEEIKIYTDLLKNPLSNEALSQEEMVRMLNTKLDLIKLLR